MPAKREPKPCTCGCGDWTRGGRFLPGHDARYHSAQRKLYAQARDMLENWSAFDSSYEWFKQAARYFADYQGPIDTGLDRRAAAIAILTHPRMQDTDYNIREGYTPYTSAHELYRRILRVSS